MALLKGVEAISNEEERDDAGSDLSSDDDGPDDFSSDEERETSQDEKAASKLLSDVVALYDFEDGPRKRIRLDAENNSSASTAKLSASDLLKTIRDDKMKQAFKLVRNSDSTKSSKQKGMLKKLSAPLPKLHQNRLDREQAYIKSKETLNR